MATWEALAGVLLVLPMLTAGVATLAQTDEPATATVHHVHIDGFTMQPSRLVIEPGDAVEWHNHDGATHTASEGSPGGAAPTWSTGFLSSRASEQLTFDTPASYTYYCKVHAGSMNGFELIVQEDPDGPAPDLSVVSTQAEETEIAQEVEITAEVTNLGDAAAPATTVGFTAEGEEGVEPIGAVTIDPLGVGASTTVTFTWDTTGSVGAFTVAAIADVDGEILETDEFNNQAETGICIPDAQGLTCVLAGRSLLG